MHHYSRDHYADWRQDLGDLPILDRPGAFGENLSATGPAEDKVCVGDIYRLGNALIQISQGRQPCQKLNHRFSAVDMARRVQVTGRTAWYHRVLRPAPLRLVMTLC